MKDFKILLERSNRRILRLKELDLVGNQTICCQEGKKYLDKLLSGAAKAADHGAEMQLAGSSIPADLDALFSRRMRREEHSLRRRNIKLHTLFLKNIFRMSGSSESEATTSNIFNFFFLPFLFFQLPFFHETGFVFFVNIV